MFLRQPTSLARLLNKSRGLRSASGELLGGSNGEIVAGLGSDNHFYVLSQAEAKVTFIQTVKSWQEVLDLANSLSSKE